MSTVALSMASPRSLKRTYDDADLERPLHDQPFGHVVLASTPPSSVPDRHEENSSQASPASLSSSAPPLSNTSNPTSVNPTTSSTSAVNAQSSIKKPKLTFDEKETMRAEKEFKAREKAELKAKKEEERATREAEKAEIKAKKETEKEMKEREKAQREEEKRAKDAAKEEKRKDREEQTRLKQEEKQQKEDEKNRKARNQIRISAFFGQPPSQPSLPNGASFGSPPPETHSPLSSRRSSISEIHAIEAQPRSRSISMAPQKPRLPDYEREFPSFFLHSHTALAPYNRFLRDEKGLVLAQEVIDEAFKLKQEDGIESSIQGKGFDSNEMLHISPYKAARRRLQVPAVKDVMADIDGTTSNPVDLTHLQSKNDTRKPLDLLKSIPIKFLKFQEDVRPPYIGTYTRLQINQSISKLARNPLSRSLPDTNYDYDSEAEWEEPVEGEDLDSEGDEEEDDEEDGNEMDGFLDDENTTAAKRRPLLGDMEPICSGLCWEGPGGQCSDSSIAGLDWRLLKLDILLENPQLPIDPYSTAYWQASTADRNPQITPQAQRSLMQPPRMPLHPVNRQNALLSPSNLADVSKAAKGDTTKPIKPKRLIPPEVMDDFKAAVEGNDLTKLGLMEVLKRQFPKQSKDAIKDTLEMIAERVGPTKLDKKWMLKSGF